MEEKAPEIDLESIIKSKNPRLHRFLPRFLINLIKRIIHQNEINDFLKKNHTKKDFEFIAAVLDYLEIKITCSGLDNIPKNGGVVIAANHPLGGPDALALMHQLKTVRSDMKFLVNDILMNLTNIQNLFTPVNKHGKNAAENIQRITQTYSSEACTLIFPAGLVSRKQNGKIADLEWHKSFITQSVKHKRNIIPVFIDAQNSSFFYNLALWRKRIGIKANIEMLFLVDELYKKKKSAIQIFIGEAIDYTTFTKEHSDRHWAKMVKEQVYALKMKKKLF